ncbi:molybdopterin-dependent oxidoreductase [Comamonadaceae bacterium M7527]|nr:molybdopterin-dependent oxidoreductase [Comamonadaceae bacterium M7527]
MQRRTVLAQLAASGALASMALNKVRAQAEPSADLLVRRKDGTQQALGFEDLHKLVQYDLTTSSPWYEGKTTFRGPLLRDVLALTHFQSDTIVAKAVNDYRITIPYEDVVKFNVVLAHTVDGERLTVRTRGPLFVIYPFDQIADLRLSTYYARCIWQLTQLEEQ